MPKVILNPLHSEEMQLYPKKTGEFVAVSGDTLSGNIIFPDNISALFGTGSDLKIFHNGTDSYIQNNTGGIVIENDYQDGDITFKVNDGGVDTTVMTIDGATGNVGIGTTSPATKLHVSVDGNTPLAALVSAGASVHLSGANNTSMQVLDAAGATSTLRPLLLLTRSRGTLASPTTVVSGDLGAEIISSQYDGTSRINSAGIRYWIDDTVSTGIVPQAISFETGTTADNKTSRLWVSSSGNVGIGTTGPATLLHIDQSVADKALPVVTLDQADVDEPFIKFIGTVTDGASTGSLVEVADATATIAGYVKVEVQDDGNVLTDQDYYLAVYTLV